ncbi:hypothetical protein UP10_35300 [Bradyrhizobium sp. LTSPM299]|nr:hypothetical protein UP10_35300 [Bradyrhizobium sp. LTSPM299]
MVWCAALALVAVGPIDYPAQPSLVVLAVVGTGLLLFLVAYRGGGFLFEHWFARQEQMRAPSSMTLNRVVVAASLIGITGIGFIALDRIVLSGVSNSGYSELLRCAPGLVDAVAIKRTPLLYLGYVMFSFGFVSMVLFLLRGEVIRGWAAALAQLSVVSPVGYALLYSGRMPILLVLVLLVAAMLIRISEGRQPLPAGHHLVLKTIVVVGLFVIYSSSIWSSRQNFCAQVSPLIRALEEKQKEREAAAAPAEASDKVAPAPVETPVVSAQPSTEEASPAPRPTTAEVITAPHSGEQGAEAPAKVAQAPVEAPAVPAPRPTTAEVITAPHSSEQGAEAPAKVAQTPVEAPAVPAQPLTEEASPAPRPTSTEVITAPHSSEQRAEAPARAAPVEAPAAPAAPSTEAGAATTPPKSTEVITATDFSKRMAEATAAPPEASQVSSADAVLAIMLEAWNVKPRSYVTSALESSHLSARAAMIGLSTYFYLTHGVRMIDIGWHARDKFSRHWGAYEVGVLSPMLRVFAPENLHVATMETEQRSAGTYGFFPTVWLAAFIDFGIGGAVVYILVWGCVAGWSAAGARRSRLMTPQLLLVFVLASILLSPVQGPLGIANSALVLGSMLLVGLVVDVLTGFSKQGDQGNYS